MTDIRKELFQFLRDLTKNNDRDWFQKNKPRYERDVKEPLLQFVSDFGPHLRRINPHLVADPRAGGRLALSDSPRRAFFGGQEPVQDPRRRSLLRTKRSKNVHAPGYYLHLEPGSVFAAAGIWHPDPVTLKKVRDAIVADSARLEARRLAEPLKGKCALGGETR